MKTCIENCQQRLAPPACTVYMHFNMKWERCENTAPFCVWTRLICLRVRSCSNSPVFCPILHSKKNHFKCSTFRFFSVCLPSADLPIHRNPSGLCSGSLVYIIQKRQAQLNSPRYLVHAVILVNVFILSASSPKTAAPLGPPNTSFAPHSLASGTMDATWTNKNSVLCAASVYPADNL